MASGPGKSAAFALLVLNVFLYFIVIAIAAWAVNHGIERSRETGVRAALSWHKRLKIALDTAKGLAFLHDVPFNKRRVQLYHELQNLQGSTKILMKVAHLAYQCLSQNPKGRPVMSQVIEILEPLATQEAHEEETIQLNGGASVTLYEVPKRLPDTPMAKKVDIIKSESHRETEHAKGKHVNGRSKSEPPKENFLCSSFQE